MIFVACAIVPLLVLVHQVPYGEMVLVDAYSWWKMAVVVALGFYLASVRPLPVWTLGVALACALSARPEVAWMGWPEQFMGGNAIIALMALGAHPTTESYLARVLGFGAIPVAIWGLLQACGIEPLHWHPLAVLVASGAQVEVRKGNDLVTSTLFNANYVGLYVAGVVPLLWAHKKWASFALVFALLLVSGNRAGVITALVGFFAFEGARRKAGLLPAAVALVTSTLCIYLLKGDLTSMHERLGIWRQTLPLISVFGSGPGMYPLEFPQPAGYAFIVDKPHNLYLQIAHAFGWFGLALFLAYAIEALRRATPAVRGSLVGFLVCGLTTDLYIGVAPVFAVVIGLGLKGRDDHVISEGRRVRLRTHDDERLQA